MSDRSTHPIAQYVADRPRLMGVLFMLCLLSAQAAPALANTSTDPGP